MTWWFGAVGALLVIAALVDAVSHTIALRGGGPIAKRVGATLWRALLLLHNRSWFPRLSTAAGPVILLLTFLLWSLLLWSGWTLIFWSDYDGIVKGSDGSIADFWDRVYYAGFSITTLGIGDYQPRTSLFQVLTTVSAGLGFFLITLFVTYLLSVLSAVISKRSLAFDMLGFARTPEDLVIEAWESGRFRSLEQYLLSINNDLVTLSQQHLAYPTLHYFRTMDERASPSVAVAVWDDALTLIQYGIPEQHRPDRLLLRTVRNSIQQLAETVAGARDRGDDVPPPPDLGRLRAAGIPTVEDEAFAQQLQRLDARRATLQALLCYEGRDWNSVRPAPGDSG